MSTFKKVLGSYFGLGFIPFAPGTWGSFGAMCTIYMISILFPVYGVIAFLIVTCILSLLIADYFINNFGDDAPQFVMDEAAGQAVVFLFSGFQTVQGDPLWILFLGFLFFRVFDIFKPLGIARLEKFPGKFGILADDILAGIYALACLELTKTVTASLI
jgi:phosphatidylglycerophosphatase A